jgi:hypothetical protein
MGLSGYKGVGVMKFPACNRLLGEGTRHHILFMAPHYVLSIRRHAVTANLMPASCVFRGGVCNEGRNFMFS